MSDFPRIDSPPRVREAIALSNPLQEIMCCLGQSLAGNPTQYLLEKSFVAAELDGRFLTLEVLPEDLADAILGIRAMGFRGASVALPFKHQIIELLDRCSEEAELIGAVNCVSCDPDGHLVGENTEGKGFCRALATTFDIAGKNIVILGAGLAGRAIAVQLALAGAGEITVVNRTVERGQQLTDLLTEKMKVSAMFFPWMGDFELAPETDLLINTTSIGEGPAAQMVPVALESLLPSVVVADIVLGSSGTPFMRAVAARGCAVIDGQGMLVEQLAQCFQIWTGTDPDRGVMREALEEFLEL